MERLTIPDVRIGQNTIRRSIIDAEKVKECAMEIYWRLKSIEDAVADAESEEYDLDRLRELAKADRAIGREIFLPNDGVRGTVEGFRAWKDGSISFSLVDGRHRYSLSSDLVYKFLVGRDQE